MVARKGSIFCYAASASVDARRAWRESGMPEKDLKDLNVADPESTLQPTLAESSLPITAVHSSVFFNLPADEVEIVLDVFGLTQFGLTQEEFVPLTLAKQAVFAGPLSRRVRALTDAHGRLNFLGQCFLDAISLLFVEIATDCASAGRA